MKKLFFSFLFTYSFFVSAGTTSLSGHITDKQTHDSLIGVTVYISDLKVGAVTDINGFYKIENLPQVKVLVQVKLIGYKTITQYVDLFTLNQKDFEMETSAIEEKEVVVTGVSQATERHRVPIPITIVSKTALLEGTSGNIINAISKQPGIAEITTGGGISKPVIRGLGYNRVVVVNDGIRQEGQQWGDEHGIEMDEFSVDRVEIIKGPASLTYGSDAMAGVINFISAPTLPEGEIKGSALGNYQSNNNLIAYSANIQGNKKGFIWDARYSNKSAGAYHNSKDGYIYNSGFSENSVSSIVGFNKSWGYSHLHVSYYNLNPGIVEGTRDSATGKFTKPFVLNDSTTIDTLVSTNELKNRNLNVPYQNIHHYKAVLNNSFVIGNGRLNTTIGGQQNLRKEFADPANANKFGLYFILNTVNYNVSYHLPEKRGFKTSVGINGMQQTSENKGIEFLVPDHSLFDIGSYITTQKNFERLTVSGGMRFDNRIEHGKSLMVDSVLRFRSFNANFNGFSGSGGLSYQLTEKIYLKANLSRGFRAPNIAELSANGIHEGVGRYEIGDANLNPEFSLQKDIGLSLTTEHITIELDAFHNAISNYIYIAKLNGVNGGDSIIDPANKVATYKFKQGDAQLYGGEFLIDIHPHPFDWLHFENSFDVVRAIQNNVADSLHNLPFTPAPRIQSQLRTDFHKLKGVLQNIFAKAEWQYYLEQKNIFSAYGTETKTPSYMLINLNFGTDLFRKEKKLLSLYIGVNNLLDAVYQNHLSRLKYTAYNYANNSKGVYNMGRNISIKLVIPLKMSGKP